MYNQPAKQEEHHYSRIEYPLVLLRPPLHHAYCIAAYTERISHCVQPPLRTLQDISLLSQITQHLSPSVKELVQLVGCMLEESVLAQHMTLTVVLATLLNTSSVGVGSVRSGRVVAACRCKWGVMGSGI